MCVYVCVCMCVCVCVRVCVCVGCVCLTCAAVKAYRDGSVRSLSTSCSTAALMLTSLEEPLSRNSLEGGGKEGNFMCVFKVQSTMLLLHLSLCTSTRIYKQEQYETSTKSTHTQKPTQAQPPPTPAPPHSLVDEPDGSLEGGEGNGLEVATRLPEADVLVAKLRLAEALKAVAASDVRQKVLEGARPLPHLSLQRVLQPIIHSRAIQMRMYGKGRHCSAYSDFSTTQ